jgi:uncharacterized protein (TIGR02001 family)
MKKIAILAVALATVVGVQAQEKKSYSVTTDFTYSSEYVFRGVENQDNAFQSSVEITAGDIYVGLWTSQALNNKDSAFAKGSEVDIYGGYKYKVSDALTVEAVGTYYLYPSARSARDEARQSYELGAGATYNFRGFSPSIYYYYDLVLESTTVQGSIGYSYPLKELGASLDLNAFVGSVDTNDGNGSHSGEPAQNYNFYGADVSVVYNLAENARATFGVHYTDTWNLNRAISAGNNLYWTASISVGF